MLSHRKSHKCYNLSVTEIKVLQRLWGGGRAGGGAVTSETLVFSEE